MPSQSLIGRLAVDLIMETAAFEEGATYAEKRLGKMSKKFEAMGKGMVDLGQKLSLAVTAPIIGIGAAVLKMSGNFEGAMNRLSISTKAGASDMKAMSELALKLGKDTTFGATEAADAMDMLAKNGLSARQILDGAANAAVNLAAAAGSDLEPAANAVTDVMQQFKLTTKDLPTVVNQITGAVNESKLSFEDFTNAIGQGGGVAGSAGVEFVDFATGLAAISPLFNSGADAGTAFKTFLVALTPATKKAAALIEQYGLKFYDAQGNLRSMGDIAEELQSKLGGLNEQARLSTLKEIFGTDALRVAVGLMDQGAEGLDKVRKAIDATDAAAQAAKQMEGFNGQVKQLGGALETLAIRIGQSGLLDFMTRLVKGLADLVDKWAEASPATLRFATILAVVAAAVGPLLIGVGLMVQAFAPLIAAFSMISAAGGVTAVFTALAGVLGPLLPILAAVAVAGALVYANWDKIAPVLEELWTKAQQALGPPLLEIVDALTDAFSELWNGPLGEGIRQAGAGLVGFQLAYAKAVGPVALAVIGGLVQGLANLFRFIADGVKLVSAVLDGDWTKAFTAASGLVKYMFGGLPAYVIGVVNKMVTGIRDAVVTRLDGVWDGVKTKIDAVKGWFFGLYDAVVGHSYVPDMVDGIAAQMLRLDGEMVKPVEKATKNTKAAFAKLAAEIKPLMEELFPEARASADFQKKAGSLQAGIAAGGSAGYSKADLEAGYGRLLTRDMPADVAGTTGDAFENIGAGLGDFFGSIGEMSEKVAEQTLAVKQSFADMARDVTSSLQNLGNSIKSGGFLDIFGSVVDLLLQIGSIGGFGKGVATSINSSKGFGGFRAAGGPVVSSKSYVVGENGPEWFTPGAGGRITPMNDTSGSTVTIVPTAYFDAHVDGRAARVAAPMAMAAGQHGSMAAQGAMQRRGRRRIPG